MRKEKLITPHKELELIEILGNQLLEAGYHAGNSIIITVSTDYSATVGQVIRHRLSHKGEICYGFGIDVPYPDETWDDVYQSELAAMLKLHSNPLPKKNIILVEACVIRGSNYEYIVNYMQKYLGMTKPVITATLFENIGSKWESDFVAEYYDNEFEDITFWWEQPNNHWN